MINPAIENDLKRMSLNDINYADYIKENYIQIPDNATNGDALKTLFPYHSLIFNHDEDYILFVIENSMCCKFTLNWWNSPYKADKEGD